MARATRPNGKVDREELPEDGSIQVFTVISNTLRDSLGAYCVAGQEAALNKRDAKKYYKLALVQAAMPEFGGADDEPDDKPKRTKRAAVTTAVGGDTAQVKP
jgi:hypothetical protein